MPRPARPMDPSRRALMFDVAARAFVRHGYEAASLNAVLGEAGVAKSSFYHHVGDKQALYDQVLADRLAVLTAHVPLPDLPTVSADAFWSAVDAGLAALAAAATADPRTLEAGRLLHLDDAPQVPARTRFLRALSDWFDDALARGRASGCIDTELPVDLQRDLVITVAIRIDRWTLERDPQHTSDVPARILRRLLAPRETP